MKGTQRRIEFREESSNDPRITLWLRLLGFRSQAFAAAPLPRHALSMAVHNTSSRDTDPEGTRLHANLPNIFHTIVAFLSYSFLTRVEKEEKKVNHGSWPKPLYHHVSRRRPSSPLLSHYFAPPILVPGTNISPAARVWFLFFSSYFCSGFSLCLSVPIFPRLWLKTG